MQGRAAAKLRQLQQRSPEADLLGRPPGGANAVRHTGFLTQQENTQRYYW